MVLDKSKIIDIFVPTEPNSLMRGTQVESCGLFRLSRRTCELNSIKILFGGSCGWLEVVSGLGRPLFRMPSSFTGSFPLGAEAEDGLIVYMAADISQVVQLSWREPDTQLI